jgi:hypothetical protein
MSSTMRTRFSKIEKKFEASLDQVLLGLQHRGLNLKDFSFKESQDVVQKVGRRVLQRADEIRAQLAGRTYSPSWLKDVSLAPKPRHTEAAGTPFKKAARKSASVSASKAVSKAGQKKSGKATPKKTAKAIKSTAAVTIKRVPKDKHAKRVH